MAKVLEMPFERQTPLGLMNCVLDGGGVQISHQKGHLRGDMCQHIVTYLFQMNALHIAYPVPAKDECIHCCEWLQDV